VKVHLLGLPPFALVKSNSFCAFTARTIEVANMIHSVGYDVRLYGTVETDAACTEFIPIADAEWQAKYFGKYDWVKDVWNDFGPETPHWTEYNNAAIAAIRSRMEPGDVLGLTMGWSQRPVALALPELFAVEVGIGYQGVWAPYRIFESYAWMHYLAGKKEPTDDIRYFDAVIPRAWDPADFPLGKGEGDYALFVGRLIRRKGVQIAVDTCERLKMPLVIAGQGLIDAGGNWLQGIDIRVEGDHIRHVGVVGPEERARLMGSARFVMAPSIYLEPFCGVAVEAMMTGSPVIATDWGAFLETVQHGSTGFRCRVLSEFVEAGKRAGGLNRRAIRKYARGRYSTDVVRHQYDAYFHRLATLNGAGWYAE
jgi:glycosyltransferase involved in cell wall biosynthesis